MVAGGTRYDAIVIGGGPAGSTAALVASRLGLRVLVLDRVTHPRFHIGESFLPRNRALIEELGLADRLDSLPHVVKHGAEFVMGNGEGLRRFRFDSGLPVGETRAWNIERSVYDNMLLRAAAETGADVREDVTVREVPVLRDGEVVVDTDRGRFEASYLLDATGQQAFLGRQLKTRRVLQHHQKVACFGHFKGVYRSPGDPGGYPVIVVCDEGWFWLIPIDAERTSIGLVIDAAAAKTVNVPPNQMLRWAIERCPVLRDRTRNAEFPAENYVCADFSYKCRPCAGPGYFLVGDAAMFVDPIFSTGVCLGMMAGKLAGESVAQLLKNPGDAARLRRQYTSYVISSTSSFFRMIDLYYQHSFRELFLHGRGPAEMHRAVISLLAGHVFPRPAFSITWRMWYFRLCIAVNRHIPLVPRLAPFSLMKSQPETPGEQIEPKPDARRPVAAGA